MTSAARAATLRPTAAFEAPWVVAVPEDPAVRVVFTGRRVRGGGEANLSLLVGAAGADAARRAALAELGVGLDRAVFMQQVHGGDVAVVTAADGGRGTTTAADAVPGVDALVTRDEDLALAVLVADCVPVVLVAPGRAVAAVHAGRGGVVAGVAGAAVAQLTDDPSEVVAVIGPAIGGCCYEVPSDLAAAVAADHPAAAATTTWGTPSLDLPAAVTDQLSQVGVHRIQRLDACTRCDSDTWFSHRAATAGAAPHGRQAGFVVRASTTAAPPKSIDRPSLDLP